jgi:hypothetical protein
MLQHSGSKAVTPQTLSKFARTARQRIRLEGGGYRRDHLRALAQRVEVAEGAAAPDTPGERRRKRGAHSGTELAGHARR